MCIASFVYFLHCALAVAHCNVIGPVYRWVCLWVCYHDNWKLRASILTKLGPREGGLRCGGAKIFGSTLLQPARSVCVSLSALLSYIVHFSHFLHIAIDIVWLGSVVVRAPDLQSTGRGFNFRPVHCRVATLGKLFTRAQGF